MAMFQTYYLLQDTVFSAMRHNPIARSIAKLRNEEQDDAQLLATLNQTGTNQSLAALNPFKTTDTTDKPLESRDVLFDDPISKTRIALTLSAEAITKLQKSFDFGDFYERKDGILRLSGKAEAFVSGWFGDLAYKQNYMRADFDKNGKIEKDEWDALRGGFFSGGTYNATTVVESEIAGYQKGGFYATLNDALNALVLSDSNSDGHLMRFGEFQSVADAVQMIDAAISSGLNDKKLANKDLELLALEEFEKLHKDLQTRLKEQQLLQKLKDSDGALGSLTNEEREILQSAQALNQTELQTLTKLETKTLQELQDEWDWRAFATLGAVAKLAQDAQQDMPQNPELDSVKNEIAMQLQYGAMRLFEWRA